MKAVHDRDKGPLVQHGGGPDAAENQIPVNINYRE